MARKTNRRPFVSLRSGSTLAAVAALILSSACSRGGKEEPAKEGPQDEPTTTRPEDPPVSANTPAERATLLVAQAHFEPKGDDMVPGPAKLVLMHREGDAWTSETILDPDSNVFHKAVVWRGGILTIGGSKAILRHWKKNKEGAWKATTLWQRSWGGKFDRLRDMEIGDVNGDGKENIVLATHDQGVVAVGSETDAGWEFVELGRQEDTFVHEIELGDLDGDGKTEIYCTPSERNRASGLRQAGSVVRYAWDGTSYVRSVAARWEKSHAKEILVADVDGDGNDELYAVREAEIGKNHRGERVIKTPVKIVRLDRKPGGGWTEETIARIEDRGTRFLVPGDVDGDGATDLVAASMHAGLWLLRRRDDGTFEKSLIDANSSGFEHATDVADLDGDGRAEIYVASDDQGELRCYEWKDGKFTHRKLATIPERHITWNIQHGVL